jgi:fructokinase
MPAGPSGEAGATAATGAAEPLAGQGGSSAAERLGGEGGPTAAEPLAGRPERAGAEPFVDRVGFGAAELAAVGGQLGAPIVAVRPLTGGYRNRNVVARTAAGHRYVLRRYLDPAACAVESALAVRLADSAVPVPRPVFADPAGTLLGDPLLVSAFAAGTPGDRVIGYGTAQDAAGIGAAMGETLAAIGSVGFAAPGFFGPDLTVTGGPVATGLAEFVAGQLPDSNAAAAFSPAELDALQALAERSAPLVETVRDEARLVHCDYNPKNVLAVRDGGGWRIGAVLDWEFALSGSPMFDLGNALRFAADRPAGYADRFVAAYRAAGGLLPADWRAVAEAVDLFALVQFLSRPTDHRYFAKSVALLRRRL